MTLTPVSSQTIARRPMRAKAIGSAIGTLCVLLALLFPATIIARLLTNQSAAPPDDLVRGALLFKAVLVLLGISVLGAGFLPIWDQSRATTVAQPDRQKRLAWGVLAVVVVAGAALRIYHLNSGMWYDEIVTNVLYARMPYGTILTSFESENQHFLYSLLAHTTVLLFGNNAWALRLPAAMFGIGSIWALYLFGREVAGEKEGLLAAALLTVSYTHIWFSQNARGYSGLLFWTLLSSWLLLRGLREQNPRLWLAYALTAALGVYTHVTMVFVIFGQFLVYVATLVARRDETWPSRWTGLLLGFGPAGLLTLQLYALVLPQIVGGMGREASLVAEWKNPLWTALEIAKGMQVNFQGGLVALAALAVFGAGLAGLARKRWETVLLTLVPPSVGAAAVIGLGHHLWPRFFFFAIGFGALAVVHGAVYLSQLFSRLVPIVWLRADWVRVVPALALVAVAASSVPLAYGPKQDYKGALDYVKANVQPGDAIATAGLSAFPYENYYQTGWVEVKSLPELNALRARARRTWLVYTFPTALEAVAPELMASLRQDFQVVQTFPGTVNDGTIFVCRADAPLSGLSGK
jgi:mannosyltransferase